MIEVSVYEAKTQLSRLLDLVQNGEEVIICRDGKPAARLEPIASKARSPFGGMKGQFELPENWDQPLSVEEADAFWEGKW